MKKKLQETYDLAVREVLADLSVMEEDDEFYTLSVNKDSYDRLLAAEHALCLHNHGARGHSAIEAQR
jgi:hypothetical protein